VFGGCRFAPQSLTNLGDPRVLDPLVDMLARGDSTGPRLIRRFLEVTSGDDPGRAAAVAHRAVYETIEALIHSPDPS
jgi:hypothetical protein